MTTEVAFVQTHFILEEMTSRWKWEATVEAN